jgi:hypothetical protein
VPPSVRQWVRVCSDWERDKATRLAEAGYPVTVLEGDPATKTSATDIRAHLTGPAEVPDAAGLGELVPAAVARLLAEIIGRRGPRAG